MYLKRNRLPANMHARTHIHMYMDRDSRWWSPLNLYVICTPASALVSLAKIFIRVWHGRGWKPAVYPSSLSFVLVVVVVIYVTFSCTRKYISWRFAAGCTSFHSRYLRHTFTELNWFSRTIHVRIADRFVHRRVQWQVPVFWLWHTMLDARKWKVTYDNDNEKSWCQFTSIIIRISKCFL